MFYGVCNLVENGTKIESEVVMNVSETLVKLAKQGPHASKKELYGPWLIEMNGTLYAVATDSRGMIWSNQLDEKTFIPMICDDKTVDKFKNLFSCTSNSSYICTIGQLKRFTGGHIWKETCPACNGSSADSEYVSCSFCDDDGWVSPGPRFGFLCDVACDLNRLACLLEPFPDDASVHIHIGKPPLAKENDNQAIWVIGDTFRVVLMCMMPIREDGEKWQEAPRYPQQEK